MIHYHGTPITPRHELLKMAGRNFCVSYASPNDLKTCLQIGQSVMLDNGAFSAYTKGRQLDVDGYKRWVHEHLHHPHWCVIPDVIGGDEREQRKYVDDWPFSKWLSVPVFHLHLPSFWLLYLAQNFPRIAIGSSGEYWQIGTPKWRSRMDWVFNTLAKNFSPLPWVHGMRMLGLCGGDYPLASADSTNIGRNFKNIGKRKCPEAMAEKIDRVQTPSTWKERELQCELL